MNILKSSEGQEEEDEVSMVVNAALIDFYLWNYAKSHSDFMQTFPIHRTHSIFY